MSTCVEPFLALFLPFLPWSPPPLSAICAM
jgi:hypothetical protein